MATVAVDNPTPMDGIMRRIQAIMSFDPGGAGS